MQSREEYDRINEAVESLEREIRQRKQLLEKGKGHANQLEEKYSKANRFMPGEEQIELERLEKNIKEIEESKRQGKSFPDDTFEKLKSEASVLRQKSVMRERLFYSTSE